MWKSIVVAFAITLLWFNTCFPFNLFIDNDFTVPVVVQIHKLVPVNSEQYKSVQVEQVFEMEPNGKKVVYDLPSGSIYGVQVLQKRDSTVIGRGIVHKKNTKCVNIEVKLSNGIQCLDESETKI